MYYEYELDMESSIVLGVRRGGGLRTDELYFLSILVDGSCDRFVTTRPA